MLEATAAVERRHASGYRLKFDREKFLKLVNIVKPAIVYKLGKNHFFTFDDFVMYSQKCGDGDLSDDNRCRGVQQL